MGWLVLVSARIPATARATAASRLAAAAWRSVAILSCSAGMPVIPRLLADRDGHRLAGPGWYSGAAHRAGTLPGLQGGDDRAQRGQFGVPPGEPDVAGSHLGSGALAVLCLTGLDEFLGGGQLGTQIAEVAGIGGEMIAGQAGVPAVGRRGGAWRTAGTRPRGSRRGSWRNAWSFPVRHAPYSAARRGSARPRSAGRWPWCGASGGCAGSPPPPRWRR